jgi:hypothetical protein
MLLGGPQNTIKSHLVFTALFCFASFSVFSCRLSAPYLNLPQKAIYSFSARQQMGQDLWRILVASNTPKCRFTV